MKQKTIWTMLLTIGILSSFLSCDTTITDNASYEEYCFINNSDYEISNKAISKNDDDIQTCE